MVVGTDAGYDDDRPDEDSTSGASAARKLRYLLEMFGSLFRTRGEAGRVRAAQATSRKCSGASPGPQRARHGAAQRTRRSWPHQPAGRTPSSPPGLVISALGPTKRRTRVRHFRRRFETSRHPRNARRTRNVPEAQGAVKVLDTYSIKGGVGQRRRPRSTSRRWPDGRGAARLSGVTRPAGRAPIPFRVRAKVKVRREQVVRAAATPLRASRAPTVEGLGPAARGGGGGEKNFSPYRNLDHALGPGQQPIKAFARDRHARRALRRGRLDDRPSLSLVSENVFTAADSSVPLVQSTLVRAHVRALKTFLPDGPQRGRAHRVRDDLTAAAPAPRAGGLAPGGAPARRARGIPVASASS